MSTGCGSCSNATNCLVIELNQAEFQPLANSGTVDSLKSRMIEVRGYYGQVVCEIAGCSNSSVVKTDGFGIMALDSPEELWSRCAQSDSSDLD